MSPWCWRPNPGHRAAARLAAARRPADPGIAAEGQRHVASGLPDRAQGIRIIGSIVGTRADLAEVFRLHAAGRTRVLYEARNLEGINQSIEDVLASRVPARLVMLP
jgi:D-arabinose 1-dehydrogenase-like Zn-dependent alcohol dehydrogenase